MFKGIGLDGEIQKSDGVKIGKIKPFGDFHKKTLMFDVNGSVVLSIYKKLNPLLDSDRYTIKDADGNEIGRAIEKGFFKTSFIMVNPKGEKILTKKGPKKLVGVNEMDAFNGKNVAKFEVKYERINLSLWKSYDTYMLPTNH